MTHRYSGCKYFKKFGSPLGFLPFVCILLFLEGVPFGFSQATRGPSTEGTFHEAKTLHYRVFSQISPSHATEMGAYLEQLYQLFNSYFHFPELSSATPLTVRIFHAKEPFDRYLSLFLNESREDFVYLHHSDPTRRELLLYQCPPEIFYPSLNHQALLQFLRSHIQNPPLWIREGFAIFFEKVGMDPSSNTVRFKENLDWLDTLKGMIEPASSPDRAFIPLERFLFLTPEEARQNLRAFYPQAWGLVTFLLYAEDRSYPRFLWDTLSSLKGDATLGENNDSLRRRVLSFYNVDKLEQDFKTYIQKRPSFTSLMKTGITAYEKDAYKEAEEAFTGAVAIEPSDPLPYYYLGLIAYATKNYPKAEEQYQKALSLGGPKGLIQYALGVNAFAWNRFAEARTYLTIAIEADPSFKEKAQPLLKRLQR